MMPDRQLRTRSSRPRLPWYGTHIVLAGVIVVALVRPYMPHGVGEFALRMAGRPLSVDVGRDRSVSLIEEAPVVTGCQPKDVLWSPDGKVLVTACSEELKAWTSAGKAVGEISAKWPLSQCMQVLTSPLRIVFFGQLRDPRVRDSVLTTWDVQTGKLLALPLQLSSLDNFDVDQDHSRIALVQWFDSQRDLKILSLDSGETIQRTQMSTMARSIRWLPGAERLLLGGYNGVLYRADISTGDIQGLARPYTTVFPGGGGESAMVDGLVLSPDGNSVAIFETGGMVTPTPNTGQIDAIAHKDWTEKLGTTVEIRAVDDGRLLDRMPGTESGVVGLAWDPHDRFIAVVGRDALILWNRRTGVRSMRTLDGPEVSYKVAITDDGARLALMTAKSVRIFRIQDL